MTWTCLTVSIRRIATSINSVHVEWCLSKEIIMVGGPQGPETPGSPQQTLQSPTIQGLPIQRIPDNLASLFQSKFFLFNSDYSGSLRRHLSISTQGPILYIAFCPKTTS